MSELSVNDIRRLDQQLSAARRSELRWDAFADTLEERALDMRRLAQELDDHNAPLRRLLEPVRHLHIIDTWQGNAATNSRRRLDTIEDRLFAAARTTNDVIDDLTTQARVADRNAEDARDNVATARRRINQLQRELGALDDVYI